MMRIVLISEIFAPGMGYLENILPKYLVRLGAEVDVVASSLPPDFRQRALPPAHPGHGEGAVVETTDGFRLHLMGHAATLGHVRLLGLSRKLKELRPDVVQTMTPIGWIALEAAWSRCRLGYRLFSGCHYHASVFSLARRQTPLMAKSTGFDVERFDVERWQSYLQRFVPGRMASWATEKYYAISPDCAEVAERFFGVPPKKLEVCPLGVDVEIFHPASSPETLAERTVLRQRLGFPDGEIVCVYSGRFGADKNPLLLARAVARLASAGEPFRGLFIGQGPQAGEIAGCQGCIVQPFVPVRQLGAFYRAAEIGVWPAEESMSMLDALACGLPLVANDTMQAPERMQGTGLAYRLGDVDDLMVQLRTLCDRRLREKMGAEGARRMRDDFSWEAIARSRLEDYSAALDPANFARQRNFESRNGKRKIKRVRTVAGKRAAEKFMAAERSDFVRRETEESEYQCK
jgi:glycosyltransferase involved in cell wall biosynthesis